MKKLVGYITTSLPDNNFTVDLAYSLKDNGVDILELGVPFSDPVAEGPIIEKANLLALKNGFKINDLFEVSSKIKISQILNKGVFELRIVFVSKMFLSVFIF